MEKESTIPSITMLGLMALLVIGCSRASGWLPARGSSSSASIEQEILFDGDRRQFLLHVPASLSANRPPALVLNFHGLGATASQQERLSGMSTVAEREGFIVVYPEGVNKAWHAGSGPKAQADLDFIKALIDELTSRYEIDAKRIYATGISNGAGMANRVACDMAEEIAAIATVAGAYSRWWDCSPSRPVAVLAFHGLEDRIVPYEGSEHGRFVPAIREWAAGWAELNGCEDGVSETDLSPGVRRREWLGCDGSAAVVLITLDDHGHSWPGSDRLPRITSQSVDATHLMWDFFQDHAVR